MLDLLLFWVASILKWILTPFAYIYSLVASIIKKEFSSYHLALAIAIDKHGNCLSKFLFNDLLKSKSGYEFGNSDETISSVLGKNQRDNTLTILGKFIANTLDFIQKDHCKNAIDNNVN